MATSREVAEAYIEVHGDLSPFRRELNAAGDAARKAGENIGNDLADGFNDRTEKGIRSRWESMVDAMYSDNRLDWDKLVGKFDTTDLDRASLQVREFMEKMREEGRLTSGQMEAASKRVEEVIKAKQQEIFVQNDLNNITRDHAEAIKENIRFEKLRAEQARQAAQIERDHGTAIRMNQQMQDRFLRDHAAALRENERRQMQYLRDHAAAIRINEKMHNDLLRDHAQAIRINNQLDAERPGLISRSTAALTGLTRGIDHATKRTGLLHVITDKLKLSWARMDSSVRVVLGLIVAAAGPMAVLGSGLAGAGTALVSSLAYAVGALGAMVGPAIAFGTAIALAISSFDGILARVPRVQESLSRISSAWEQQADNFGRQWEGALDRLLSSFAGKLEQFDFGTPLGQAFAQITDGFDRVVNGPAFNAFMSEMTTNFPAAVSGMGRGLASLTDMFLSLFAGAGPVARMLAEDFAAWSAKIAGAMEEARKSGEINALFERMRESLLAVLDLAGSVGMALGTMFELGSGSGNRMLAALTDIVDRFNAWMQTDDGRTAMLEWFSNAERIMVAIQPLAVGLGQALAGLVTEHSIGLFEDLMSSLGLLLPILGEILGVISDLGILNILADALLAVGRAVEPMLPALGDLAATMGTFLRDAIVAVTPLLVAIGTAMAPIIQAAADLWAIIAPQLIPALVTLAEKLTPIVVAVIDLAAAIITQLVPVIGPLFVQYITSTVAAFGFLLDIINQVITFIQATLPGVVDFFTNLGTNITNFNTTVNQALESFWAGIGNQLATWGAQFQASWDAFWMGLGTRIAEIWTGITTNIQNGYNTIVAGFVAWAAGLQAQWDAFWNGLGTVIQVAWTVVTTFLSQAYQNILTGFQAMFVAPWNQFWSGFWNALSPEAQAAWNNIVAVVTNGINTARSTLEGWINSARTAWSNFWNDLGNRISQAWSDFTAKVSNGTSQINSTVNGWISNITGQWNNFWSQLASVLQNQWNQMTNTVSNFVNQIRSGISNFVSGVQSQWNSFWSQVSNATSNAWNQITSAVNNGINNARNVVSSGMSAVQSFFSSAWSTIVSTASSMMSSLVNAVNSGISQVMSFFSSLPGRIGAALGAAASVLYSVGTNMIQGLINGVTAMAGNVVAAARGVVDGAINAAKSLLNLGSPSKLFRQFGVWTGEGLAIGMDRSGRMVEAASEQMASHALEAFERSKARLAGLETGRGLAEGIAASKSRIQAALGNVDPNITSSYSAEVAGRASRLGATSTSVPVASRSVVFQEGAVTFETQATQPKVLANIFVDEMDALVSRTKL